MEDPNFTEENNGDPAAGPFADFTPQLLEKSLDVSPGDAATDGTGVNQLKGAPVTPPQSHGTEPWYQS